MFHVKHSKRMNSRRPPAASVRDVGSAVRNGSIHRIIRGFAMPKAFERCRASGGKIRTIRRGRKKYQRVCVRPKGKGPRGGRTVGGEVKTRKKPK